MDGQSLTVQKNVHRDIYTHMVKLQLISDVHVEFHADRGRSFAREIPNAGGDALVIAGDFGTHDTWREPMKTLCDRFERVIYVCGNHEYYGSSFIKVHEDIVDFSAKVENFTWLNNDVVEVGDKRILGTTLWFRNQHDNWRHEWRMSDFHVIVGANRIYAEHDIAAQFLERELKTGDVVVTHHLPVHESISDRFMGSDLNRFFFCDMRYLIAPRMPAAWLHGHTHDAKDRYVCSGTRIVCNPHGYPRETNLGTFKEDLLIEV